MIRKYPYHHVLNHARVNSEIRNILRSQPLEEVRGKFRNPRSHQILVKRLASSIIQTQEPDSKNLELKKL